MSEQKIKVKCKDCKKEFEMLPEASLADSPQIPSNHIWTQWGLTNHKLTKFGSKYDLRHIRKNEKYEVL